LNELQIETGAECDKTESDLKTTVTSLTKSMRKYVIGITFAAGLTLGVLAVLAVQNLVLQKEHSSQDIARDNVERTGRSSARDLASTSTVRVAKFEEIFKHRSPAEQYEVLYNSLSQNNERELKKWWIQSQKIERTSHRTHAQQVILRYLTAIDPQEALRFLDDVSVLQRDALSRTIFSEWAVLHLDDAIVAAAKLVGTQRTVVFEVILKARDDLPEDRRRAIAAQLEQEETYHKLTSEAKALQSVENPSESWSILLNDDVDDMLQMESLAIVAETWREQIGFEVLSKIYHSEIKDYKIKSWIVAAIARTDPALALDYAKGVSKEDEQSYLSHAIVEEWARTDPLAALGAVSTFEPSSLVGNIEKEIAEVWARTTPYELIKNIELVSVESRMSPLERAFSYIAREDPLGAIKTLSTVEDSVEDTSPILRRIVNQWAMQQPETATQWVLNNVDQEDPELQSLLWEVLPSLARQDPIKAFEVALNQSASNQRSRLESLVVQQLTRHGNIELAISLLPRVSESSQSDVYHNIAEAMVNKGRTFEALELGSDLEPELQQDYYRSLVQTWATADSAGLYKSLDELPTSAAQSSAAAELIWRNQIHPVFSDDQLDQARAYLNSSDAAYIKGFWIKVDRSIP